MDRALTILFSEPATKEELVEMWRGYFGEIPTCSKPGCNNVAQEVDDYFPYLDDLNRCNEHLGYQEATRHENSQQCSRNNNRVSGNMRQTPGQWKPPANN